MRAFLRRLARVAWLLLATGLPVATTALAIPTLFPNAAFLLQLAREPAPVALPSPVQGIDPRFIRDTFGAPRGGGRRHDGVDVFAPLGTLVLATTRGIVWRIGANRLGGNVVWILGPDRQLHYLAHLERVSNIRVADRVRPGTVLGFVGASGNAKGTPPHLHYGIYRTGARAIDPYPLLRAGASANVAGRRQFRRSTAPGQRQAIVAALVSWHPPMKRPPPAFHIPDAEIRIEAVRAQGAGGQNVNKVSNAVHLRFDVPSSSLPADVKDRLLATADQRISGEGVLVIKAQRYRSLEQNRVDAIARLHALLATVAAPPRPRKPTRPTHASKLRRVETKTRRGRVKALRGRVVE